MAQAHDLPQELTQESSPGPPTLTPSGLLLLYSIATLHTRAKMISWETEIRSCHFPVSTPSYSEKNSDHRTTYILPSQCSFRSAPHSSTLAMFRGPTKFMSAFALVTSLGWNPFPLHEGSNPAPPGPLRICQKQKCFWKILHSSEPKHILHMVDQVGTFLPQR